MTKFRNIYSKDRYGRDVNSFADEFKNIFLEFGHIVNYAYIDYAWENGLSLKEAAWDAISADREMESYICDDYTLQFIERLRTATADEIESLIKEHESGVTLDGMPRLVGDIPERSFATRGWAPQTPPKLGFYRNRDDRWYVLVNRVAHGNVWLLPSSEIVSSAQAVAVREEIAVPTQQRSKRLLHLPPLTDTLQSWQARVAAEGLVYRGDFWSFRDDLIGHPCFGEFGKQREDASGRREDPSEWLL